MENRKETIAEQLPVFLAQILLCVAMVAVYGLLGRLNKAVILGAVIGTAVSLLNHLGLILSLLQAEENDNPQKGQLKAQGSMMLRFLLMIGVLVLALKFLKTDPIATLLPLILMRIALFLGGLMIKHRPVDFTPIPLDDQPESESESDEGGTL